MTATTRGPIWGTPKAPLLPRWYRQAFASSDAPAEIAALTGTRRLADTASGWADAGAVADGSALRALAAAVDGFPPPPGTVVADTTERLAALPVQARTRRAVAALETPRDEVTVADLLRLRGFGTFALLDVMCAAEATEDAAAAARPDLAAARRAAIDAAAAVQALLAGADDVDLCVARRRLAAQSPATLAETGAEMGCSRETIRRRESRIAGAASEHAAPAAAPAVGWIQDRLGLAAPRGDLDEAVAACVAGVADPVAAGVVEHLLRCGAGYRPAPAAGYVVSPQGADAAAELTDIASALADEVGLAEESDLLAGVAGRPWVTSIGRLIEAVGLRVEHGVVDVSARGGRAAVKAALLRCGAPATAQRLSELTGLKQRRVSEALSELPSVVRTDKVRWGLRRWRCGEYRGLAAEMRARIDQLGGEADLGGLAQELSQLYGVRHSSVRAMARTPEFVTDGDAVRVAETPETSYPPLSEAADGRLDGDPYWTFAVGEQHLRGYSIASVPPAAAAALGCGLGGRTKVPVREPGGCPDVSVIWRTTCITGPEIGRSSKALAAIGAQPGTRVRVVVHADPGVSFVAEEDSP